MYLSLCFLLENGIDGTTLSYLVEDQTEFVAMFPKSSQRLLVKRALNSVVDQREDLDCGKLSVSPNRRQVLCFMHGVAFVIQ